MRSRRVLLATFLLTFATAGCGATPPTGQPTDGAEPASSVAGDGVIELRLTVAKERYQPQEPVGARASLAYLGASPVETLAGSGSGLVIFGVKQLDGDFESGSAAQSDCVRIEATRGVPIVYPFEKSGGFSDTDPDAARKRAFFADPLLRLPEGRWRITAYAELYIDECGGEHHTLSTSVDVAVEP